MVEESPPDREGDREPVHHAGPHQFGMSFGRPSIYHSPDVSGPPSLRNQVIAGFVLALVVLTVVVLIKV